MTAHTPGPWRRNGLYVVASNDTLVLQAPGINEPLHIANLTLAVAAPDMLRALQFVAEEFNSAPEQGRWLGEQVRAAIAKAEGR